MALSSRSRLALNPCSVTQAVELRVERARAQVELPDISDLSGGGPRTWWTLVISPVWQANESFILEDLGDGHRTEAVALVG